ncbi:MAG: UvrB/UvrC motif-containing protein [Candidatus Omnitrophota bacterium]|nr:UvrB/UvrC motif-containing protein [Candidatus Omnitrophota bacterium]
MLCDICGKNEATVHFTEIINDRITKLHLCEGCAKHKGEEMEEHFGLADLLAGLADLGAPVEAVKDKKLKCPSCGLTYSDFKKIGKMGCGRCYDTFKIYLVPLLKRIHGSDTHAGKAPRKKRKTEKRKKTSAEELKRQLKRAVELEEFEEAARLRDEIKKYEQK